MDALLGADQTCKHEILIEHTGEVEIAFSPFPRADLRVRPVRAPRHTGQTGKTV